MTKVSLPPLPPVLQPAPAAPARLGSQADPAKIAKAAQDFEAMAIGQLLQPMFDTVKTARSAFGGGAGEEAWQPMLVQEIAKQIAAHGGLGLAKPVYDAMLRMQESKTK
jgi:flagellar protein FlgJ